LIKGSKDLDSSLVFNENTGEIPLFNGLVLDQVSSPKWAKIPKTYLTCDITHKKWNPNFFLPIRRIFAGLNSSRYAAAKTHENCLILADV